MHFDNLSEFDLEQKFSKRPAVHLNGRLSKLPPLQDPSSNFLLIRLNYHVVARRRSESGKSSCELHHTVREPESSLNESTIQCVIQMRRRRKKKFMTDYDGRKSSLEQEIRTILGYR